MVNGVKDPGEDKIRFFGQDPRFRSDARSGLRLTKISLDSSIWPPNSPKIVGFVYPASKSLDFLCIWFQKRRAISMSDYYIEVCRGKTRERLRIELHIILISRRHWIEVIKIRPQPADPPRASDKNPATGGLGEILRMNIRFLDPNLPKSHRMPIRPPPLFSGVLVHGRLRPMGVWNGAGSRGGARPTMAHGDVEWGRILGEVLGRLWSMGVWNGGVDRWCTAGGPRSTIIRGG
ncbi:hypothetical protein OF83DRAFT_1086217 [Amylostereum chailletii]|nr:hypothetical protein OF83DRAFT_1086217 [Amylostereum chailletii]